MVGCSFVGTAIVSDRAGFVADGEAHDERPDEHRNVDRPFALDDIALLRDVFDKRCWKERSQPPSN